MSEDRDAKRGWDAFFFYLHRVNALVLFLLLLGFAVMLVVGAYSSWQYQPESLELDSGFRANNEVIAGEEFDTVDGKTIAYTIAPTKKVGRDITGKNITFVETQSGRSQMVIPEGSDHMVLNWDGLEFGGHARAYSVLTGNEADFEQGLLDWTLGKFSSLEQKVMARRLRYVDSPRLLDAQTMSVIVWPTLETAEFWLIDLTDLSIVSKRPVSLPPPGKDDAVAEEETSPEDAAPQTIFG